MVQFLLLAISIAAILGQIEGLKLAKNYPGSPEYPNDTAWRELNLQVGNRLHKCSNSTIPACGVPGLRSDYVLQAWRAEDVSAALKFATKHKLRVTVRNTGHDFLARHSGEGGLAISTKGLTTANFMPSWIPSAGSAKFVERQASAGITAIAVGAAATFNSVAAALRPVKHQTVRGADATVGVAGWVMGGGHGPYSATHGMGCDNVLEFEVVLTNGSIVITNEDSYPDLFWALRGGGGSTYGVVTQITLKTFLKPFTAALPFKVTGNRDAFLDAMAYFFSLTPKMSDFGITGYPNMTQTEYCGILNLPGKSLAELQTFMKPIISNMTSYGARITYSPCAWQIDLLAHEADFVKEYRNRRRQLRKTQRFSFLPPHNLPVNDIGSRLLLRSALHEGNQAAIRKMLSELKGVILPYGNIGGQVTKNKNLDVGLNPAWRNSVMHIIAVGDDIKTNIAALDRLSANHAAYWNEGFDDEQDWKTTYFGPPEHYAKLLAVKRKYDPTNTLWCSPCVGGDVFSRRQGKLYIPE